MITRSVTIAWRNLAHDPVRTTIALAGSLFSLIVIFMQLGFLQATQRTATLVLDKLDFDLVVTSKDYQCFSDAGTLPMARVRTAGSVPGVASVVPFYVRSGLWQNLEGAEEKPPRYRRRSIMVLSYSPADRPFRPGIPGLEEEGTGLRIDELEKPYALFLDLRSRPEFGPKKTGTAVELNNQRFRLGGTFAMGSGFAAEGAALLSRQNFARAFGGEATEYPSLALIKLKPSANAEEVEARLRKALPGPPAEGESAGSPSGSGSGRADADVRVLRRPDIERREQLFWLLEKTIGVLFGMGVVISFLVGLVVFYQVLSSDIADHLSEYATLKAMGYSNGAVSAIVIAQASILGLLGYLVALAAAAVLFDVVYRATGIEMTVVDWLVLGVPMVLSQVMAIGSALLSIRKLASADPADLFR